MSGNHFWGWCVSGRGNRGTPVAKSSVPPPAALPEPLTYDEAQKMVQFEVNGLAVRVNINDTLDVVSYDDFPEAMEVDSKTEKAGLFYFYWIKIIEVRN